MNIELTCPHCQHQQDFQLYREINVSNEPALKNSVLNFELFKSECEACHQIIPVAYQTIYHDFDLKLIVLLDPTAEQTLDEVNQLLEKEYGELKDYTIRLVHNPDQLKEKVLLRDARLDDRLIEIVKQYYAVSALEKDPNLEILTILFNRGLTEHEIVFVTKSQQKFKAVLDMEIVRHLSQLYKKKMDQFTKDGCNLINHTWAHQILQAKH